MHMLLSRLPRIVFDAEGGSGGGGAAAGAAPAGDAAATSSTPSAPPSSSESVAAAAAPSQAATPAASATPPADAAIYKPEGLPDHLVGKTNQETIDNLKKAVDGYRNRDAEAKVPEDAAAYLEFSGDIPDTIKTHLETLKSDPLFERMNAEALKHKMSVPAYQAMVQSFLSVSAEMGLLEPPIDVAAERAALVPDGAKHLPQAEQQAAAEKRMNENFAFVDQMVARGKDKGGLSKDAGEFAKAMLGDSAKGHEFIEFLRAQSGGGQGPAMGLPGAAGGNDARAELQRRAALPENTIGNPKFDKASHAQLQADYERLLG